ncbi:MAG: hypothetical protein JO010_02740 [Alphaproteobacteria bacterium]|nr:hypothetical protein [Alphaproteobacteria bacterium]
MNEFAKLSRAALDAMAGAASEIRECERVLGKSGDNVVGEALRGGGVFYEWHHYPEGDVYDPETHAQFFYHAHAPSQRVADEHGHFHTFMRPRGMLAGTQPLMLPELAIADVPAAPADPLLAPVAQPNQGGNNDKLSHLVAIAMNPAGAPVRLFTTNRWVTGETWYAATDVCAMLDRFSVDLARPSWPLNRWISAMFRLFKPQMCALLHARDAAIMSWRRRHRGKIHVFEDRRLEVASTLDIDLEAQIRAIEQALRHAA